MLNMRSRRGRNGSLPQLLMLMIFFVLVAAGELPTALAQEEPSSQEPPSEQSTSDSADTGGDAQNEGEEAVPPLPEPIVVPPPDSAVAPANAAQSADKEDAEAEDEAEEIVIRGSRDTVRSSIYQKRTSATVVEALSAEDIGDIPALSIGEALETLTGASSHRDQGGATEISIRGMGPYLGSTVINGREASNGSGDRSINFSLFPSELFTKLKIFKTQEARFIEGGVSGQILLETLQPLAYGKRRLQVEGKLALHPDNFNIEDNARDVGGRGTISYVDQFDLENLGQLGVSIGYQNRRTTNPEQEFRTTSMWRDCRADPTSASGVFSSDTTTATGVGSI